MSERLRNILNHKEFISRVKQINILEANRKFCLHGFQHYMDTARITYILLLENNEHEKILPGKTKLEIKEVVYAAGLLHDLGRVEQYHNGIDHALTGAKVAKAILTDAGFSDQEIKIITKAISEHREYSKNNSLFGQRLYQADKLSRDCHNCGVFDECKIELELKQGKEIY
jgi:uncharacterized protein